MNAFSTYIPKNSLNPPTSKKELDALLERLHYASKWDINSLVGRTAGVVASTI